MFALIAVLDTFSHRQLLFVLCVAAVLLVVAANREARKAFWQPARPPQSDTGWGPAIRAPRLLLVYALGAVIVGGSFFSWVKDAEYWPFSPYPMFSWLYPGTDFKFTTLRLYAVVDQEQPVSEFPLDRNEYLEPLDNSRLPAALALAIAENRLAPVLQDCLKRYQALRAAGIHRGPPIEGLRLYRVSWNLNAQASNVETPNHRELLGEFPKLQPSRQ